MLVALYARVSTTRQAENDLSIPDQLAQLKEWVKANGHTVVHEYVEPGASATDDKRPVFQQMISDAQLKPPAFEAVIIHSLSRFFRDAIQFGVYERKLAKNGIKVISITQQTGNDTAGEMMRRIISTFDEYQSKENSKHTSRAMRENARQGFFNGSYAPFGFKAVATDISGSRGRKKKRLEVNEAEAGIVRMVYDLYLRGYEGRVMGVKEIAKHLSEKGLLMRGKPWGIQKVHRLLSDPLYMGTHYFNVIDSKTRKKRPPAEWIPVRVAPIIDAATFERARSLREERAPRKTPPRLVGSSTLLTGLLKCGICGGSMTLVTGKSGRYKYYKCTTRQNKGNHACSSGNLSMERLDEQVLNRLAEKVFAPSRLQAMVVGLRKRMKSSKSAQQDRINELNRQLKQQEERQNRLLNAIETGIVPLDESLQRRAQHNKAAREALLIELAGARRQQALPMNKIRPSQVEAVGKALRSLLLNKDAGLAKGYLGILVDQIVVTERTATITGSNAALAATMDHLTKGTQNQVPSFMCDWRARRDSNSRPPGS